MNYYYMKYIAKLIKFKYFTFELILNIYIHIIYLYIYSNIEMILF